MNLVLPISFFAGMPGGGEMLLVFLVILLVFGSKKLPSIARDIGRALEHFRKAANDVRDEITRAGDEVNHSLRDASPIKEIPPKREKEDGSHDDAG